MKILSDSHICNSIYDIGFKMMGTLDFSISLP